jgi:hypothetical protein
MASFSIYTEYHEEPGEQCNVVFAYMDTEPAFFLSVQYVCVDRMEGVGGICFTTQSVCPIVRFGSPHPLPPQAIVSPPWTQRGGGTHSFAGEGVGDPIRTTG